MDRDRLTGLFGLAAIAGVGLMVIAMLTITPGPSASDSMFLSGVILILVAFGGIIAAQSPKRVI